MQFLPLAKEATGEVVFFPSTICLDAASCSLKSSSVKWGAQNCHSKNSGAFTGETSAQVVKDMGGQYILLGHSERRSLFGETDSFIADKLETVQALSLTPMLCIGETLQEREAGSTVEVVKSQLQKGLAKAVRGSSLVVAYEPVWAIGTGKVATPEQVEETHTAIAGILKEMGFNDVPVLYGGSVKPDNAPGLMGLKNVSGFLVGGASLEVDSFIKIAKV